MTASARQRPPKRVPILRSPVASSPSRDDDSQPCGGQQPFFCSEEQKGEEAASPGNQSRKRVFWKFPPGHSLSRTAGYRWLCRNQPAQPGTLTFRFTHSPSLRRGSQHKKRPAL